jgi:hypothetical protein
LPFNLANSSSGIYVISDPSYSDSGKLAMWDSVASSFISTKWVTLIFAIPRPNVSPPHPENKLSAFRYFLLLKNLISFCFPAPPFIYIRSTF